MTHTVTGSTDIVDQAPFTHAAERHALDSHLNGALHPELLHRIRSCGFTRAWGPCADTGPSFTSMCRTGIAVARHCPAAAWRAALAATFARSMAFADPRGYREVYDTGEAGQPPLISGSLVPGGKAVTRGDEWVLTGRWGYVSGCLDADWLVLLARVADVEGPDGLRYFILQPGDVEVCRDWEPEGMRATGSHSVDGHEVVVPQHRTFARQVWDRGALAGGRSTAPLESVAGLTFAPSVIGCAQGLLHVSTESLKHVTKPVHRTALADAVAKAEAQIYASRLLVLDVARRIDAGDARRSTLARCAADCAVASAMAREAVQDVSARMSSGFFARANPARIMLSADLDLAASHIMLNLAGIGGPWLEQV